jgi:bifunctional non-homologous end joining protein LigD
LRRARIKEKTKLGEYLIADDIGGIVSLAQLDVLEIHTWNSVFADVERPNRSCSTSIQVDEVEWPAVVRAARMVRDALTALRLESFVKTTGGRGLHIVVPLTPHADWSQCLEFSRALSDRFEHMQPSCTRRRLQKPDVGERSCSTICGTTARTRRLRPFRPARAKARRSACRSPGANFDCRSTLTRFTVLTVPKRLAN